MLMRRKEAPRPGVRRPPPAVAATVGRERLTVKVSCAFKERVRAAAAREGKTPADFMREALLVCCELVEEQTAAWAPVTSEGGDNEG